MVRSLRTSLRPLPMTSWVGRKSSGRRQKSSTTLPSGAQHLIQGAPDGSVRADLIPGDQDAAVQPVRRLVAPEMTKGDGRRLVRVPRLRRGRLVGRDLRPGPGRRSALGGQPCRHGGRGCPQPGSDGIDLGVGPDPESGLLHPSGHRFGLGRRPTTEGHAVLVWLDCGRPRGRGGPCRRRRVGRWPTGARRLGRGLVDRSRHCQGQVVPAGLAVFGLLVGVDLPGDGIEEVRLGRGRRGCRPPTMPGLLAAGPRLGALGPAGGLPGRPGGRCFGGRLSWSCHVGNPRACRQAAVSYRHSRRRPRAAHNPTWVATLPFTVLPIAFATVRRPGGAWSRRWWRAAPPRRRKGPGHRRARCGAGWQARWPRPGHAGHRHGRGRRGRTPGGEPVQQAGGAPLPVGAAPPGAGLLGGPKPQPPAHQRSGNQADQPGPRQPGLRGSCCPCFDGQLCLSWLRGMLWGGRRQRPLPWLERGGAGPRR
jgi:hypothetical protein